MIRRLCLFVSCSLVVSAIASAQNPHLVVYEGSAGPGRGKHIVFLAGDHEYRSEESLPALARIMAQALRVQVQRLLHHQPGDRLHRAGQLAHRRTRGAEERRPDGRVPALPGLPRRSRCSTSSTTWIAAVRWSASAPRRMPSRSSGPDAKFLQYTLENEATEYPGGFGRQVLGETWVSHYGTQPSRRARGCCCRPIQASHPILRGVKDVWVDPAATPPSRSRAAPSWRSARSSTA